MSDIAELMDIMARLRDPNGGCPWHIKQNFDTIAPYTIEEAYEVADAIDRRDYPALCDELGDLLLQVVFHARMAQEAGHFDFADVVKSICAKMTRRHPHVFAGGKIDSAEMHVAAWDEHKRREREETKDADTSVLAGIAHGLPEWLRALKLQKRAATVGFDWPSVAPVLEKLHEEIEEVRAEFAVQQPDQERLNDEIGDVLFVCVNLARHAKVDFSQALRCANAKFERRFRRMEQIAASAGTALKDKTLAEQDLWWDQVKMEEKPDCGRPVAVPG